METFYLTPPPETRAQGVRVSVDLWRLLSFVLYWFCIGHPSWPVLLLDGRYNELGTHGHCHRGCEAKVAALSIHNILRRKAYIYSLPSRSLCPTWQLARSAPIAPRLLGPLVINSDGIIILRPVPLYSRFLTPIKTCLHWILLVSDSLTQPRTNTVLTQAWQSTPATGVRPVLIVVRPSVCPFVCMYVWNGLFNHLSWLIFPIVRHIVTGRLTTEESIDIVSRKKYVL